MTKKQNPKLNKPKLKHQLSEVSDYKDILAITEGRFGEPVKRSGRFINASYPPDDGSQAELRRFWGEPRKRERNLLDKVKVKAKAKKNEPTPQ